MNFSEIQMIVTGATAVPASSTVKLLPEENLSQHIMLRQI